MNTKNCIGIDPVLLEAYKANTGIDIPKAKACMRDFGIMLLINCINLFIIVIILPILSMYGYNVCINGWLILIYIIIFFFLFIGVYGHEKNHRIVTPIDFQINTIIRKMYLPNTHNNEPVTKELLIKAAEKAAFGIMRSEWVRLKVGNLGINSSKSICLKDRVINTVEKISRRHRENFRLIMEYLKLFGIECSETEILRTGYNMVEKMMIDRNLRRTQA